MDKDVIVIGGGPGGYVAAIRAAQLGKKVALIERDKFGGTCLNRGCIPTKALYKEAEILNTLKRIDEYGISIDSYKIDVEKIQTRKQSIVDQLVSGIEQLLKANSIEVIKGSASFKDKNAVMVSLEDGSTKEITASNIIVAAGSKPAVPPIPGADMVGVYTSEDILNFESIPESLTIIGGGVIGMEFAGIFNSMGTKVTVVEFLPNILGNVDSDIVKRFQVSVKKKGISINTSCKVTKIEKTDGGFKVCAEGKKGEIQIDSEKVLISTGRIPSIEGLNLENAGIEYDKKGIKTDENYETNIKGIYAIGDVNGKVMLAHAASYQGIKAAEAINSIHNRAANPVIPGCIFVFPEIATAGITEDEAKANGMEYKASKFMFGANGKALTLGEPEGFVKVISSSDIIIGVHIMGPHASDLIHEGVLAIANKLDVDAVINTIHAHPTLSESFSEAVAGLKGEAIHIAPLRR